MGVPQIVTKTLASANAALIVASATPVSGTAMTLVSPTSTITSQPVANGTLALITINSVVLDTPRRVLLTYGNEASNRTMAITGTNYAGNPLSETLTVPSGGAGTVATKNDFATVTQVLPLGGGWTAAVTVGTNTVGSSRWLFANQHVTPARIAIGTILNSGAANWSIEYTYDNPNPVGLYPFVNPPNVFVLQTMSALSASSDGVISDAVLAWRLTINSGTGSVTATSYQEGIMQ